MAQQDALRKIINASNGKKPAADFRAALKNVTKKLDQVSSTDASTVAESCGDRGGPRVIKSARD